MGFLAPLWVNFFYFLVGALVFGIDLFRPYPWPSGAGAESRAAIGMVILGGLIFATTLTLFIIPVLYNLLARFAKSSNAVEQELERLAAGPSGGSSSAAVPQRKADDF